jgi:hypothetical protein
LGKACACGFTTTLEAILAEMFKKIQSLRPAAVPQESGTASQKNPLCNFDFAHDQFLSKRKREFFCSAPR